MKKNIDIEVTVNNQKFYYNSAAVPLRSRRGKIIGKIIALNDITTQKKLLKSLEKMAAIDELTGLYNRRHFMMTSKKEITRAKRYLRPLALLIIDLDFFKNINDTYGHQAGDNLLVETAIVFKNNLRISDTSGRYGGEEFLVLLPETNAQGAETIALRIKDEIEALRVDYKKNILRITASMGISCIDFSKKEFNEDLDQLLNRMFAEADKALYRAKNGGRNRVELFLTADNPVINDHEPPGKKA